MRSNALARLANPAGLQYRLGIECPTGGGTVARSMSHPPLPESVRIVGDVDVARAWEVFERFEALHHGMAIMNPLSTEGLDTVLAGAGVVPGWSVMDLACGHGELLIRAAERGAGGVGVDISPWALRRATEWAAQRGVADRVEWWLADAGKVEGARDRDVAAALGASWVWDGYRRTVAALAEHVRPGGVVIIGDPYRRPGVGPADVEAAFGEVPTLEDQADAFAAVRLDEIGVIDTSPTDWEDYQRRIADSAERYLERNPGEAASEYHRDQHAWAAENAGAARLIGWNVRIGRAG